MIGRLLDGRYRVLERIARGGMASIYRGEDVRLDRVVAIKVMHPGMGDDGAFAARFVREAQSAARLSHPHVVAVHDQGTDDGSVYLVMEFVEGRTLRDVIRTDAPLRPLRALELLKPILLALSAAHRTGLVHRDVKPENVLISTDGRVKVVDFGLAKAVSAETQHTATGGVLIGTVSYLAPELVVEGRIDPRVDVYAAGVLLYELLTGAKPHQGELPIQIAYAHVHQDVPAPSALVPGLPDYVDALVARATARDRTLRPADASVLLHHVNRVSQALSEGVDSDPELATDLRPMAIHPDTGELVTTRTAPDPFPEADLALLRQHLPEGSHGPDPADVMENDLTTRFDTRDVRPEVHAEVPAEAEPATTTQRQPALPAATVDRSSAPRTPKPPKPPRAAKAPKPPKPSGASKPPKQAQGPARRRRGLLMFVGALVLAVGIGAGAWWFGWERYTITPGVLGLEHTAAVAKVEKAGLAAKVVNEYSETIADGHVISTDPARGDKVLDHGTVTLVVSQGKERYEVPKVAGLDLEHAEDELRALNLVVGATSEKFSEKVAVDLVIRSDPAPGTKLRRGDKVDLVFSKGRRPRPVRDWTGKDVDTAEARLGTRGFTVVVKAGKHSDTVAKGKVLSQSPSSGTLFKGDTVTLVPSLGPELITVPKTLAKGVDDATKLLEDLGFKVDVRRDRGYLGLGFVFRMTPSDGTKLPKGSTVTLYLV